ncbi:MAG TPA: hypothetical protein VLQ46_13690 [Casimicrobiaceae bacterium]|nr:hypothetical protein [Casimicrobiaceae bacterium]
MTSASSAFGGHAEAQYRIGRMYEFGKGYPHDWSDAAAGMSCGK